MGLTKGIGKAAFGLLKRSPALLKKTHNFIKKWGEISNVDTSYMYQYQDTFADLKGLLNDVFSTDGKSQVPILNQFGVPEKVKDKLSQFDDYIKKYDKTRTSIKSLADDFVYDFGEDKDDKKKNESLYIFQNVLKQIKLFEDVSDAPGPTYDTSKGEEAPAPPITGTDNKKEPEEQEENNDFESLKEMVRGLIGDPLGTKLAELEKMKETIKKTGNNIQEKIEIARNKIKFCESKKEVIETQLNFVKNDTSNFKENEKNILITGYNQELENNKLDYDNAQRELKTLKLSANFEYRGKLLLYFKIVDFDRKNKKIKPFNYASQYIYKALNSKPQIFDEFIKEFYGNNEKDKKWETGEIINLLEKPKEKFKNVIAQNNENYFNSEEKDKNIAIYGDLCLKTSGGEHVLVTISKDTRSTGEDIEDKETEDEFFIELITEINRRFNNSVFTTRDLKVMFSIADDKSLYDILYTLINEKRIELVEGMDDEAYKELLEYIKSYKDK